MDSNNTAFRWYRRASYLWALVFAVVGAEFVLLPQQVASDVNEVGALLGLSGKITTGSGSLWHVLAASLMATITVLAWQAARRPGERGPYLALLTAKLVSTGAFLLLAREASVWLLCAFSDGFVAASLWASRAWGDHVLGRENFMQRYLKLLGADAQTAARYDEEVKSLPRHVRWLHALVGFAINLVGPLLLLRTVGRAAHLDDAEFVVFCERLSRYEHPWVRCVWLVMNMPGVGILTAARTAAEKARV